MNASHLSFMSMGEYPVAIACMSSRETTMPGGGIATGVLMGETLWPHGPCPSSSTQGNPHPCLPMTSSGGPSGPHSAKANRAQRLAGRSFNAAGALARLVRVVAHVHSTPRSPDSLAVSPLRPQSKHACVTSHAVTSPAGCAELIAGQFRGSFGPTCA